MPDLNSLPPSRSSAPVSPSIHPRTPLLPAVNTSAEPHVYLQRRETPSPRSSSISLAATATINAADLSRRSSTTSHTRGSPRIGRNERRRSNVPISLNLNDTGQVPGEPGEQRTGRLYSTGSPSSIGGSSVIATGDPHHQRTSSLGELHQELEQEQEAQVNRLLQMIRIQQVQLESYHTDTANHNAFVAQRQSAAPTVVPSGQSSVTAQSPTVFEDSTPPPERSFSIPFAPTLQTLPRTHRRTSRPRTGSSGASPASRSFSAHRQPDTSQSSRGSGEWPPSPIEIARRNSNRDESAFYQAESANLSRENQMLRLRIRELERQVSDLHLNVNPSSSAPASSSTPTPAATGPTGVGVTMAAVDGTQEDKT